MHSKIWILVFVLSFRRKLVPMILPLLTLVMPPPPLPRYYSIQVLAIPPLTMDATDPSTRYVRFQCTLVMTFAWVLLKPFLYLRFASWKTVGSRADVPRDSRSILLHKWVLTLQFRLILDLSQVCGGDICNPEIASSCPYPEVRFNYVSRFILLWMIHDKLIYSTNNF